MTEVITENLARRQQEIERIQNNPDLSTEAKQRMINELRQRAAEENRWLRDKEREAIKQGVESAERKVLGIPYPERSTTSERAMIALSYRDTLDRAEKAATDHDNPGALSDLLQRAEVSGDELLGVAIYHTATRRGARQVADTYLASRPKEQARWERYVEARKEAEGADTLLRGIVHDLAATHLG